MNSCMQIVLDFVWVVITEGIGIENTQMFNIMHKRTQNDLSKLPPSMLTCKFMSYLHNLYKK